MSTAAEHKTEEMADNPYRIRVHVPPNAGTAPRAVEMPSFESLLPLESDPRVKILYETAKKWAGGHAVTAGSVISFATFLIAAVQELVTETQAGPYKKQVLLTVLRMVIMNDIPFDSDSDRQTVLGVVEFAVPVFIDTAIGIARGDIDLHKMFASCSPCCGPGSKAQLSTAAGPPPQ
jgi:hypothetical protein